LVVVNSGVVAKSYLKGVITSNGSMKIMEMKKMLPLGDKGKRFIV